MVAVNKNTKKDFNPDELLTATQNHEQKLAEIMKRIAKIEDRVLSNESFARTFSEAQRDNKSIDTTINAIIDEHDKHKIISSILTVAKWLIALIIGGIIGAYINNLFNR